MRCLGEVERGKYCQKRFKFRWNYLSTPLAPRPFCTAQSIRKHTSLLRPSPQRRTQFAVYQIVHDCHRGRNIVPNSQERKGGHGCRGAFGTR